MTAQIERNLQTDILYRLNRYPVVAIPVPNGIWLPARSDAEKDIVKRLIARMKSDGMLVPGAPDLVLLGAKGAVCVELKREPSRDLFMRRPRGRLSPEQKAFKQRCADAGVGYLVAYYWADVERRLGGLCRSRSAALLAARRRALTLTPEFPGRAQWLLSGRRSPSIVVLSGADGLGARWPRRRRQEPADAPRRRTGKDP